MPKNPADIFTPPLLTDEQIEAELEDYAGLDDFERNGIFRSIQ